MSKATRLYHFQRRDIGMPHAFFIRVIGAINRLTWAPTFGAVPERGGARFSVWAPRATRVDLVLERDDTALTRPLARGPDGVFSAWEPDLRAGARYRFSVDGGAPLPDPASRSQPDGVHGSSALVDPSEFVWTDRDWQGRTR